MGLRRVLGDADSLTCSFGSAAGPTIKRVVSKNQLPGRLKNKAPDNLERLEAFRKLLQENVFTKRKSLASLPDDEETKHTDPARENVQWDGSDIIYREWIVEEVYWNKDRQMLQTRLRKANR
jgi:hypothetical protein